MLKDKTLTYISLFSSAGVGCYGLKMEGYKCIATNELLEKRLNVQKYNNKCDFDSGYISGDISEAKTKNLIFEEIDKWKKLGNDNVDVIIATPPCQGISVINHKKNAQDINRNSLVVESIELVKEIQPRFFIFENVMAFEKTLCITPNNESMAIGDYIRKELGEEYIITGRILNFMNYGSNSSRTRTVLIGVNKKYKNDITPLDLYPNYTKEKTLREVIQNYPQLEWGEINSDDFYHAFRTYEPRMRDWIRDLKEGESAFDNKDPLKRPHRIVNGEVIENSKRVRDKYTRHKWDKFPACISTRNDALAAQNTVHPEEDRVFSIRELMSMMNIPKEFKWVDLNLDELNSLNLIDKKKIYKENEMNIRQSIGEAVPSNILLEIAKKIKNFMSKEKFNTLKLKKIIDRYNLEEENNLFEFIKTNEYNLEISSLMRLAELCNTRKKETSAYYTNKFIVNEIFNHLPNFNKDEIHVLEPSVGIGGFLPFIFKKYESVNKVNLDIIDIDEKSIEIVKLFLKKNNIPSNFNINFITADFLTYEFNKRYDLVIGNPPFTKMKRSDIKIYLELNENKETTNLAAFFLEKCLRISDHVALVLQKSILSSSEFDITRSILRSTQIKAILDFGRHGFTGVSIETICLIIDTISKPKSTLIYNMKQNKTIVQNQKYITDIFFPYFIIYRNEFFDEMLGRMDLGKFNVFRDRQITKKNTISSKIENSVRVLKARNIDNNGKGITSIPNYDTYIELNKLKKLNVFSFFNDSNVYLTPNMTYNTRVIKNIPNVISDGSVAILIPKDDIKLTDRQLEFFSSDEYREFYRIARNLSTQSINVDNTSVYFYGVLKNDN
ncbi:DNA cytosine methyltransferase [Saccharococcus sp. Marseille-Q5394]|uniref:DNA cytosine methyltransferase n=1 Tax=Saccharococcus sp. Marseille-Q5394 TaxID=2972778 RepID=UPI0021C8D69C|nr:DNA cytosine methyltransferase [Saccharococcus sp. Marseille-Q5394]